MINLLKKTNKNAGFPIAYTRSEADQSYAIISGFMNITATGWFSSNLPSRIAVSAPILRRAFTPAPPSAALRSARGW
jgi:hypothetical protein